MAIIVSVLVEMFYSSDVSGKSSREFKKYQPIKLSALTVCYDGNKLKNNLQQWSTFI